MLLFLSKALRDPKFGVKGDEGPASGDLDAGGAKIRCPLCAYAPTSRDRWSCLCGFLWNTFDTHGRCPACSHQWKDTACPRCERWSAHDAWYAR